MTLLEVPENGKIETLFSTTNITEIRRFSAWFNAKIAASQKISADDLLGESFVVTPAMAEWLLVNKNHGNRPVKKGKVAALKRAITAGKYKHTSQGLAVTRNGRLINGQHRLHAIVAAGVPVKLYFVFNERDDAFDVLDNNMTIRGGADTLHVLGHKNVIVLAAAARIVLNIENGVTNNFSIENAEIGPFVDAHPGLAEAPTLARPIISKFKMSTGGAVAAVYYISKSRHAARLDEFLNSLVNGTNLKPKSPILVLRDGLQTKSIDDLVRSTYLRGVAQAASIITAWNLWNAGRSASIHSLKWSSDRPFPKVD